MSVYSQNYPAGEIIFEEDTIGDTVCFIKTGSVEVSKKISNRKVVLGILGPNDIFGEMSVLGSARRSATITTLEDTALVIFGSDILDKYLGVESKLIKTIIKVLIDRLNIMDTKVNPIFNSHYYIYSILNLILASVKKFAKDEENSNKRAIPYDKMRTRACNTLAFSTQFFDRFADKLKRLQLIAIEVRKERLILIHNFDYFKQFVGFLETKFKAIPEITAKQPSGQQGSLSPEGTQVLNLLLVLRKDSGKYGQDGSQRIILQDVLFEKIKIILGAQVDSVKAVQELVDQRIIQFDIKKNKRCYIFSIDKIARMQSSSDQMETFESMYKELTHIEF